MDRQQLISKLDQPELEEFYRLINLLRQTMANGMSEQFNRMLPFNDLLFDRWERAKNAGFGAGSSVYDSCCLFGNIQVGENTWIGPNTILDGSGGLIIGSNCSISAGVQIYSHDSVEWAISGGKKPYEYAATKIGDNCYVGPNVIVSKGVEIGSGTVIGTNSFVNRSFPENSRIAGSPARLLD